MTSLTLSKSFVFTFIINNFLREASNTPLILVLTDSMSSFLFSALSLFAIKTIELFNNVSTTSKWFIFNVVPVLVKSVIKSATPMNGAASVDPLNLTIFKFRLFLSRYFLVNVGNSVANVISGVISSTDLMFESSGAAKTKLVFPNFRSSSSITSASFSLIKSMPVIPISAIPS